MKLKITSLIVAFAILLLPSKLYFASSYDYGVFIGASSEHLEKLSQYREVVIDVQAFSFEDIEYLHKHNTKVYSYLNIGSLENFRPYFKEFKYIRKKAYENWPGEWWVDLSNEDWQSFIINDLCDDLYNKGVDGFFIDNIDNYILYDNIETFNAIDNILTSLKDLYNLKIIINNGHNYVKELQANKVDLKTRFDAANQESVYTTIVDFENDIFRLNKFSNYMYLSRYLSDLHKNDIDIYVIEYATKSWIRRFATRRLSWIDAKIFFSDSTLLN